MPYASPELRAAHRRATASHASESAETEIARVVAKVHTDLDALAERDAWADTVAFAKQGEIGPPKIKSASI